MIPNGPFIYQTYGNIRIFVFDAYDTTQVGEAGSSSPKTPEEIFLSPNPAYRMCNINLNTPVNGDINIYNILGKEVSSKEIYRDRTNYCFDLSDYAPGVYLVSVTFDKVKLTKKLVVIE